MNKKEKIDALIACQRCKYTEQDREFLEGLTENQLELISPPENVVLANEEALVVNEETTSLAEVVVPATAIEWLAAQESMPQELKDQLAEGALLRVQQRAELIEQISKHPRNLFTNDRLQAMSTMDLKALAAMAVVEEPKQEPKIEPTVNEEKKTSEESLLLNYGMRVAMAGQPKEVNGPEPYEVPNIVDIFKANRANK